MFPASSIPPEQSVGHARGARKGRAAGEGGSLERGVRLAPPAGHAILSGDGLEDVAGPLLDGLGREHGPLEEVGQCPAVDARRECVEHLDCLAGPSLGYLPAGGGLAHRKILSATSSALDTGGTALAARP